MTSISNFANNSPNSLPTHLSFWLDNLKFIVILLVGLGAITVLFALTYPKSDELFAKLSIIIHGFALWGIWVSIKVIAKIQVEHAFAIRVEEKASEALREIKSGNRDRIALEKVGELLPENPTPKLAMPRLFLHIIGEAKDHRFESSIIAMQPYREEAIGDIFKLQNIQKIALQLGILGTFIGLILALSQLKPDSDNAIALQPLFNTLHISFSTSVAGLEVAAILGLLIMVVRQKQEAYFQSMETAADAMISLAQNAINEDNFFTGFKQVENAVNQLRERVFAQTKQAEAQTEAMRQGMTKLTKTKSQFDEFLNQIQESQANFVREMMGVYDIFSPKTIKTELQQSLDNAVNKILETFNKNLIPSLEKITELNNAIRELYGVLQMADNKLMAQSQQLEQLITTQNNFISKTVDQFDKGNQYFAESKAEFYSDLQQLITSQNETFQTFQQNINTISQKVTNINQELESSNEIVRDLIQLVISKKPLYKIVYEKLKTFINNKLSRKL